MTYALGCALCFYYQIIFDGHLPHPEQLRAFYNEKLAEGLQLLRKVEAGHQLPEDIRQSPA
jgi:hypothetical protein